MLEQRSTRTQDCGGTPRRVRPLAASPRHGPAAQALKPRPRPARTLAPASLSSRGPIVPAVVRGREVYADGPCRRWARGEWGWPGASGSPSLLVGAAGEGVRGGERRGAGARPSRRPAPSVRRQFRALLPASPRSVARGRGPRVNTAISAPARALFVPSSHKTSRSQFLFWTDLKVKIHPTPPPPVAIQMQECCISRLAVSR